MTRKQLTCIFVSSILGIIYSIWFHQQFERHRLGGREAFIAEEGQRWDRNYTHPDHFFIAIVVSILLAIIVFGVYESLVAGVLRLFSRSSSEENRDEN